MNPRDKTESAAITTKEQSASPCVQRRHHLLLLGSWLSHLTRYLAPRSTMTSRLQRCRNRRKTEPKKSHPSQRAAAAATTIELLLERFNKHKIWYDPLTKQKKLHQCFPYPSATSMSKVNLQVILVLVLLFLIVVLLVKTYTSKSAAIIQKEEEKKKLFSSSSSSSSSLLFFFW